MSGIAYVNGQWMALEEAKVSVEDRGFQFADGVYEAIRTYGGRPFAVDRHLARLSRSLHGIELGWPLAMETVADLIAEAARRSPFAESFLYLQITRGAAPRKKDFPTEGAPTLVLTVRALEIPSAEMYEAGVGIITVEDFRWGRCDLKTTQLLPNLLAANRAYRAGAFEAAFVGPEGDVRECSAANLFAVLQGEVRTPPKGPHLLPGITRELVLELAPLMGLRAGEAPLSRAELGLAEEVFLAGTSVGILPVTRIDGVPVGEGRPGPVTQRLAAGFEDHFAGERRS
ncbi:MAG: aminotransferase class IV [Candidatus Tectomicrobia bacterium]|uniref:Aminotransferase class IV n=1 Tax=Tectimicrobiota bacterium TaxID=2528274 RepID=A0A932CQ10_UNCTE|nr:aminotransferase class IV [Candidatus Tectomicrobia bacterium]